MSGWEPISTAPEGVWIIALDPKVGEVFMIRRIESKYEVEGHDCMKYTDQEYNPEYWIPFPELP
jgi:hypothetical protein